MRANSMAAFLLAVGMIAVISGCSEKKEPAAPSAETPAASEESGMASATAIENELAKLPEAERQVALAQKVCPVTKEPLGSMGAPIKVTKDGKDLYICCEGCRERVMENFDEYFAKVGKPEDAAATN